jgi:alkanesulfonate monooxygenase SsuD/methylene tetrahydromethanopterin reductase-like flavin-dependent oxidoreductase (luciferase family)
MRGIGIQGALGAQATAELAMLAESCGYGSFWLNVVSREPDVIESVRLAVERTRNIEIGVGVFPLDLFPAEELGPRLAASNLSMPRVIIGVASGQAKTGIITLVQNAITTLRKTVPNCRVCTAGYGPRIQQLGGRLADVVLGNWMTPERLDWVIAQVRDSASIAGRAAPPIYLYHRGAVGADAVARLRDELSAYGRYPVHRKHQAEMGNPEWIGVACAESVDVEQQLAPYGDRCRIVLKPLPHEIASIEEWRSLIRFFRPAA